jgi:SAM-dependent methyltransferase
MFAWFENWFDSPYYHLLYQDHNQAEADSFIRQLVDYLQPPSGSRFLDTACGKGRHCVALAKNGFDTVGCDLSRASIQAAQQNANEHLRFYVHDMRQSFPEGNFDYALNLFTSFGYFDDDQGHLQALCTIHDALKPGGLLIIDFMNAAKVIRTLQTRKTKTINGITFREHREAVASRLLNHIEVDDHGQIHHFEECLQILFLSDFQTMFKKIGFKLEQIMDDTFKPFDAANSNRLIMICKK